MRVQSRWKLGIGFLQLVALAGCASTGLTRAADRDLTTIKRVYLVTQGESELDRDMEDALTAKGYIVGLGAENAVPPGVQAIVAYNYNWHWDMGRYLEYFEIEFRDPDTKAVIVRAEARHPTYERSDTAAEVKETLQHIYDKS